MLALGVLGCVSPGSDDFDVLGSCSVRLLDRKD